MSTNVGEIDLSLVLNSDKFKSQLKSVDSQANTASSKISSSLSKIGTAVLTAFSVTAIIKFGKTCLDVASETSNAWIGLNSILTGQGKSFDKAKQFINDYVSDGLVPLNNAVASYKNLALRGYSSDQIQKTMNALKNSATFARQSTYSLGDAVQTATEGLKNENSVVVDNAGVTKNVAKMWEDYATSIGTTRDKLTQEQKIQAEVNGILEETKFQSNDAAIYANTYSGKLAQLNTAFTNMKTAIGNVLQPLVKMFVPVITVATNAVTKLFTALSGVLALFGFKADSVETVSSGIGDLATQAEQASDAIGGIGDSAKKAGKDAKKASNNLASFDNLNVLSKDTDSSGSSGSESGSSGSGGSSDIADTLDVTTTIEEDTSVFEGFLSKVKELASIFKDGFDISFGNTNFSGIIDHLNNIKDTLINIWIDSDVLNSAKQWGDTLLYSLGQVTGSVARIGVNIVEGLVGSIDKYLSQNVDRIKSFICNMFDISSRSMELKGNFAQALGEISDVFSGDTAKQIGSDIFSMFINPFMSVIEFASKFVVDLKAVLIQPIVDNVDKIKLAFENILKPIQTVTGTLANAFSYIGDKWNEVYDEHIHPLMESLKTGLSDTFSKFLDLYNEYVAPALQRMADKLNELWEQHLRPLVDKVAEFCSSIFDLIKALWDNILKPVIDWIVKNIVQILTPIIETLWNTICNVFALIANAIGILINTIKGIIDFIVGVFTGDWNKAWEAIKDIFEGIWNGAKKQVEIIWNAIKDIFQGVIDWIKALISRWGETVSGIWRNIWNGICELFSNVWNAIVKTVTDKINNIKDTISNVINVIKSIWESIWNIVSNVVSNTWNGIMNVISNVINWIKNAITNNLNLVKTVWSTVWNAISNVVSNIWNGIMNVISRVINNIKDTISNILNGIKSIWENIWTSLTKTISNVWNTIIKNVKEGVSGAWNAITSVFGNIGNWFKDKFSQAWQAVKNVFSAGGKIFDGIKDGILNGLKSIVNGIIGGINRVIKVPFDGLNSALRSIKGVNIMGLKPFNWIKTIGVPQIPMLAQGGYVKANTPQLAMIGDNKHQGEVVAPEDKMLDMVLTALKMFKDQENSQSNNSQGNTITINFAGTLAQLIRVLKPELDRESKRKGDKLVLGGAI